VVSEALADAGDILYDRETKLLQLVLGTDTRAYEDLGGAKRACGEDDFF
jgi:hypothetical protein